MACPKGTPWGLKFGKTPEEGLVTLMCGPTVCPQEGPVPRGPLRGIPAALPQKPWYTPEGERGERARKRERSFIPGLPPKGPPQPGLVQAKARTWSSF